MMVTIGHDTQLYVVDLGQVTKKDFHQDFFAPSKNAAPL
jgi:hypothetical protein